MARVRLLVAGICAGGMLAAALVATGSPAAAQRHDQPPGPETTSFAVALAWSLAFPEADTPAANDPACRPSAAHPRPVVLVHGTAENRYDNWARMAPALRRAGWCVFALNYGDEADSALGVNPALKATGDIRQSARELAGSQFLATLNRGGDTVPGVAYTVIVTRYDEITTPYRSSFLSAGPGATVRNVTLQDGCPIDRSDHLSMSYDPRAIGYVTNALDPAHAAPPPCVPALPVV
jgi:triacylglycerol esterase/lipase EstA (alpha/beta hydrolase family)